MKDWSKFFDNPNPADKDWEELRYQAFIARMQDEGWIKPKTVKRKKKAVAEWDAYGFNEFWRSYPKPNTGRAKAVEEWNKLKPDYDLAVMLWVHPSEYYVNTEPQFMLDAHRYLKQRKWEDEIIPVKPKLLKVPIPDAQLEKWAVENNLHRAKPTDTYFQYRADLRKYIEDNNILAKG